MPLLEALLLGIVQGLTEFLPVSSSGHVVLGQRLFGWSDPDRNLAFLIAVHAGSLGAVLVFLRQPLRQIFGAARRMIPLTLIATVPIIVLAPLLHPILAGVAADIRQVGALLCCTGLLLFCTRRYGDDGAHALSLSYGRALLIGCAQAIAILPGISRSGSTLVAGLRLGLSRLQATQFAFVLAVPAISGATLWPFLSGSTVAEVEFLPLAVGAAASFASSFVAMKLLVQLVKKHRLRWFGYYCLAAGITAIVVGSLPA